MNKNPTAVIYARVSTTRQADDGLPIGSQIEQGYQKAASLQASVLREFIDAGISGRTDDRPAFKEAVAYCKAYSVDYFICWSTSRFARNKLDAALYKRELEKAGTRIVYVSVDIDNRTNSGWMMESILEIFDEHYSRQVSVDTLRSMIKNARDGYFNGGVTAFGYSTIKEGKRKRLVINEAEAPVVRDIFRHYQEGLGVKAIALMLNSQAVLYRGKKWSKTTVTNLLKNETYTGKIVFNKINHTTRIERPRDEWIVTQSHEPIISAEEYMTVQIIFGERAPREGAGSPNSNFVFTGMLRCGSCGSSLQIESGKGRSKIYHYYNCRSAQSGTGCTHRRLPAEELDRFLIDTILEKILNRDMLIEAVTDLQESAGQWVRDRSDRRAVIVTSLNSIETRLRNLYEVLELHGREAPNLGDLTVRIRELRNQRDEAERQLIQLEEEEAPGITVSDCDVDMMAELMRDIVKTTTSEKKLRMFFSEFIDHIDVGAEQVGIVYSRERIVHRANSGTVHSDAIWLPDRALLRTREISAKLPARFVRKIAPTGSYHEPIQSVANAR
jgi:site-specific DNA recombinase